MKFKKLPIISAISIAAIGISVAVALTANKGFYRFASTKADDTKTLTITAENIRDAIGEGTAGNFVVGGLEWHVDNASYEDGVANINGGVLYNTQAAGQSVSPISGKKGNGFDHMIIRNKDSKSGINFETRDEKNQLITQRGLGAESQAAYTVDFSSDNTAAHKVYIVFMAFGAGGGTSFSSIDFQYTCATPVPAVTLTAPKTGESVGETIQMAWNFEYVGGTTPELTFVSSDTDVATVSEHGGLVTGISAGTTTISASFQYEDVTYYSNEVELTFVSSITYKSLSFNETTSTIVGAGIELFIDNTEAGLANGDESKVHIDLHFDGGTHFKGYEEALNKAEGYSPINVNDSGRIFFTVPNGFPDDDDFTHTLKVTFTKSASEIYEGQIEFVGNKYSSQSGKWH